MSRFVFALDLIFPIRSFPTSLLLICFYFHSYFFLLLPSWHISWHVSTTCVNFVKVTRLSQKSPTKLSRVQSWSHTWRNFVPLQKASIQSFRVFAHIVLFCFLFFHHFPTSSNQWFLFLITDNLDDDDAPHFGTVEDIEDGEDEDISRQKRKKRRMKSLVI